MLVYHYCSFDKLKSILQSKQFWLSDLTKSNDKHEVVQTYKVMWEDVKRMLQESILDKTNVNKVIDYFNNLFSYHSFFIKPFGVCFSDNGDLLNQWNEYADFKRGVSLCFDIAWFEKIENKMPFTHITLENSIGFSSVIYYNDSIAKRFYDLCCYEILKYSEQTVLNITGAFQRYSAFIKHPSFDGEREWRIVYLPVDAINGHDYSNNLLGVTELESVPFSHYCLPWAKSNSNKALVGIKLGPLCEVPKNEISELLKSESVDKDVSITNSDIPYRKNHQT